MNNSYFCLAVLFLLVLEFSSRSAIAQSTVKYLPGFEGPLPFQLETGYVGVDESEVELFYYFVKSENNPKNDPLILWLTGGPGCSSFSGFMYEIGPLYFKSIKYNGSLPTFILNPNSWTKFANIIFLDLPVSTGFSYATPPRDAAHSNDTQACHQAYEFLQTWLIRHPEFISNQFYMAGDSYVGLILPVITQMISDGNEVQTNQYINLEGYILGNPVTIHPEEQNYRIHFAHGMGLISNELHESLVKSCNGDYQNINPNNIKCLTNVEAYKKCISKINLDNILERFGDQSNNPNEFVRRERALSDEFIKFHNDDYPPSSSFSRTDGHQLCDYWMNDKSVQNALHVRNRTVKEWKRCNYDIPYTVTILHSQAYHLNLSKKGYRSLIYSGDHDMRVPYISTEDWIKELNYSIVDDWRFWGNDEEVAGYTRTYSNRMTFATVKGGGHTAAEYKPAECYIMIKRWISGQPL